MCTLACIWYNPWANDTRQVPDRVSRLQSEITIVLHSSLKTYCYPIDNLGATDVCRMQGSIRI